MGYLNTQLEKRAFNLSELLIAAALGGSSGAAVGALNGEDKNRLASIFGGVTGGSIGGAVGLPAGFMLSDALDKSKRIARFLKKHPKLESLVSLGSVAAPLIALQGAGAYAGSALAKKLSD